MTELYLVIILVLLIGFGIAFYFIYRHYEKLMKKEIKRAQKSEQLKSVFIENICHTLHTPLNAILSYSNLILDEKTKPCRLHR